MKSEFRLFDTYAGTIRRKEDFFTYYLASMLDFLHSQDKELLRKALVDGFRLEHVPERLLSGEQGTEWVTDEVTRASLIAQPKSVIFREVGLPGDGGNLYVDALALGGDKEKPDVIAIEAKVFDASVSRGQLEKYDKALRRVFGADARIQLVLLSTIRTREDGSPSASEAEVSRSSFGSMTHPSLVLWSEIEEPIRQIVLTMADPYFEAVFEDAFGQLKANAKVDSKGTSETASLKRYSLAEHLSDAQAARELSDLMHQLRSAGIEPTESRSGIASMLNVPLKDSAIDFAEAFATWVNGTIDRGTGSGAIESVPSSVRVEDSLREKLIEKHSSADLSGALEAIRQLGRLTLPSSIVRAAGNLQRSIEEAKTYELADFVLDEFQLSLPKSSIEFYRRFLPAIGAGSSPYLQLVSDATENVQSLGLHVSLSQPKKQKLISIMTIGQTQISIPLLK